jgi:hypothetical protein
VTDAGANFRIAVAVPTGGAVGDEDKVEQAALGLLRYVAVVVNVMAGSGLGQRVTPGRDVMPGRHDEGPEPDLPLRFAHLFPSPGNVSQLDTSQI